MRIRFTNVKQGQLSIKQRQKYKPTNRQTFRYADIQTKKQTTRQTNRHTKSLRTGKWKQVRDGCKKKRTFKKGRQQ